MQTIIPEQVARIRHQHEMERSMTQLNGEFDAQYLDVNLALEQIGDAQAMQGMLSMLEESLARDVPRIAQLLEDNDARAANRVLHGLKGFIPIFCVDSLCKHVAKVEEISKTADAVSVSQVYADLMPELEQLQAEVVAYLNDQGAAY
jgi:HPt (histidine-containing phosphotransfer) domain-containing protein